MPRNTKNLSKKSPANADKYVLLACPKAQKARTLWNSSEKWVPEYLQMDTKAGRLKLDWAHRSLALKPGAGQRPRPLIVKFHNFMDKQRVMEVARLLPPV